MSERKATATHPQVAHDLQEVWEAPAETVELPHHDGVARLEVGEAGLQPGPVVPGSGGVVLVEVAVVDAGGHERVALQVDRLTLRRPSTPACTQPACTENLSARFSAHNINPTGFVEHFPRRGLALDWMGAAPCRQTHVFRQGYHNRRLGTEWDPLRYDGKCVSSQHRLVHSASEYRKTPCPCPAF